jgi:hypothetical protein
MSEYEIEPQRGLPEPLPQEESLLWQGAPRWTGFAQRVFRLRMVAVYFAAILAVRVAALLSAGASLASVANSSLILLAVAAGAIAMLTLIAFLMSRTTVYTITNRRIVIRFGIALPIIINLPFSAIDSANLRLNEDGTGDIPLTLSRRERVSYLVMWPHVRPWRMGRVEPMLRSVPEGARVAQLLGRALSAATGTQPRPLSELQPAVPAGARPHATATA